MAAVWCGSGPPARTVTIRALALPLGDLAPLVAPGGSLLVLGGRPRVEGPFEEVTDAVGSPVGTRVFRRHPGDVPRETSAVD